MTMEKKSTAFHCNIILTSPTHRILWLPETETENEWKHIWRYITTHLLANITLPLREINILL
jgi:hypothetical protein